MSSVCESTCTSEKTRGARSASTAHRCGSRSREALAIAHQGARDGDADDGDRSVAATFAATTWSGDRRSFPRQSSDAGRKSGHRIPQRDEPRLHGHSTPDASPDRRRRRAGKRDWFGSLELIVRLDGFDGGAWLAQGSGTARIAKPSDKWANEACFGISHGTIAFPAVWCDLSFPSSRSLWQTGFVRRPQVVVPPDGCPALRPPSFTGMASRDPAPTAGAFSDGVPAQPQFHRPRGAAAHSTIEASP